MPATGSETTLFSSQRNYLERVSGFRVLPVPEPAVGRHRPFGNATLRLPALAGVNQYLSFSECRLSQHPQLALLSLDDSPLELRIDHGSFVLLYDSIYPAANRAKGRHQFIIRHRIQWFAHPGGGLNMPKRCHPDVTRSEHHPQNFEIAFLSRSQNVR